MKDGLGISWKDAALQAGLSAGVEKGEANALEATLLFFPTKSIPMNDNDIRQAATFLQKLPEGFRRAFFEGDPRAQQGMVFLLGKGVARNVGKCLGDAQMQRFGFEESIEVVDIFYSADPVRAMMESLQPVIKTMIQKIVPHWNTTPHEDILQNINLALLEKNIIAEALTKPFAEMIIFLLAVMRYRILEQGRIHVRKNRFFSQFLEDLNRNDEELDPEAQAVWNDQQRESDAAAEREYIFDHLRAHFEQKHDDKALNVLEKMMEGWYPREIAENFNMNLNTVYTTQGRIRDAIEEIVKRVDASRQFNRTRDRISPKNSKS